MASLKYYAIQGTEEAVNTATPLASGSSITTITTTPLVAMRSFNSKRNINFRVVTYDVESAIRLVKEKHPDLLITAISLKDKIDCIDPAVVLEMFDKKEET